ncbi:Endoribonuclease L-PSP/chorismate mutase-like protein [Trichoderma sp. SZMC 28014]
MSYLTYYSLPGYSQSWREKYGFSDACLLGSRLEVTGQTGKDPSTGKVPPTIGEEIAKAFSNMNDVILHSLRQADRLTKGDGATGWDYVVKLRTYHVGLSRMQDQAREIMVQNIKKWCPNHQPLFTMIGSESLPFPGFHVEIEVIAEV